MRVLNVWMATALLLVICGFPLAAQDGSSSLSGPSIGFLSDEKGTTLWPLLGVLGANVPGPALALPESIVNTVIAPQQDYALAISTATSLPVLINLDISNPAIVPLPGGRSNPSLIVLSPTGSSAALYHRESNLLQLVSGLPATPQIAYEFDASAIAGDVRDVAVSDDASLALISTGHESRSLWIVKTDGSVSPLSAIQPARAVFVAHRHDAVIADDATQEVFLVESLDQNPVRLPGVVLRDDGGHFSAIAASSDGQSLFVARQGSSEVVIVNLQTRETVVVPCHCQPTVFSPLKGNSVFRLNGIPNSPIAVLDSSAAIPRTLIIPLDPATLHGRETAR